MNLTGFLQELRRAGVTLVSDGESLKVQGPKGALTPELRGSLVSHKKAILEWLSQTGVRLRDAQSARSSSL